ncbi:MAG: hypothetical protein V3U84_00035 [Thiotrichaceae bacterium]
MAIDRFVEEMQTKSSGVPKDWTGAASTSGYAPLKKFQKLYYLIQTGAWAAGTAAVTLTQATTSAGGSAKALEFDLYWLGGLADVMVETAVTSDTFDISAANKRIIIQVDASMIDSANDFDHVQLNIASPGANADFYSHWTLGDWPALKSTPDKMDTL